VAGFFRAIALDLDGTLTRDGDLDVDALAAVDEARDRGMAAILVTGRIHRELMAEFPDLAGHVDVLVLENGAVIRAGSRSRPLAPPVEPELADGLAQRGVPIRLGECILACSGADSTVVVEEITRLGLDCQVMHNRDQIMVLPAGTSKGTGLRAALEDLGISPHNTIAVGDAENDLALLEAAEVGVAVANAVPSVRRHADLLLDAPGGRGVAALLRGPLIGGTAVIHPPRRRLPIGRGIDGAEVTVPGAQANILICGRSGAGKSHLAGLLVERWREAGYTVLVIDPEGDHVALGRLPGTIVIDAAMAPDTADLLQMLRQRGLSVVLDLSRTPPGAAATYLGRLALAVGAARAVYGLPHWVVVDEAHGPMGEEGALAEIFRPTERGHCLVTHQPDRLWTPTMTSADIVLTALGRPAAAGAAGRATAAYRVAGGVDAVIELDERSTPHTRHRQKYVETPVPSHRRFVFRARNGSPVVSAASVSEFIAALETVDTESVQHHALRGDFSRWVLGVIQDRELGALLAAIENDLMARFSTDAEHARRRIVDEITARYLAPGAEDVTP
jgi:hydroxymethylpyrimidine pyrophosphatase-like HAD family hydrolase